MSEKMFRGVWICEPAFAGLEPINVYHKQYEPFSPDRIHPEELKNIHTLFRRRFVTEKRPGRYILRFSADDYAKVYVNGEYAGQGPAPGYPEAYNYCEADITDFLKDGENVITSHVYYQGCVNRVWVSADLREGFIADLISPDGSVILCTDGDWEYTRIMNYTASRTVGYSTSYTENYDSRIPLPPFESAAERLHDGVSFRSFPSRMLQVYDVLPVKTENLPGGGVLYDFGSELTGTLKLSATGKSGDTVRILCGEETDGSNIGVRFNMRCGCIYDELWTLNDGENALRQYDYRAFRYVALIPSGSACVNSAAACVRHAAFDDDACLLETDDPVLRRVFGICKNGVKYGTQEVYVDCPSREKGQYAGDMTVTSASQLWLTGDIYMLEKAIRDQAQSSAICPGLMAVAPCSLMQEIADYSLQFPLLLLRHYAFTHDRAFLSEMLPIAEGMLAHFERFARDDGLLDGVNDKWNLVDWPENMRDGYDFPLENVIGPGVHNVINAFYVGAVLKTGEIKSILGLPPDGKGRRLAETFNRVFFRPETGLYADSETSMHSSLHSNILPAFYGFIPEGYEGNVGDFIAGKKLSCGVYMAYFLLRGLCRLGRYGDAYGLIVSGDENSWYNMVKEGATACFEAWGKEKKKNTSLCHAWASAPVTVLIEDILNVSPDGTVGQPHLPEKAERIEMKIPCACGSVFVSAGKKKNVFE